MGGPVEAAAPWIDGVGPIGAMVEGARSLARGMAVTLSHLARPSQVVTQEYPENRATLRLPPRFRGQLAFVHDPRGLHKCTVCRICEEMCPNVSIIITARDRPAVSKKELDTFVWRLDSCTWCNTCVMVCPHAVLEFRPTFETAVYDRRLLAYALNRTAGPTWPVIDKLESAEAQAAATEPRAPFDGPTLLARARAKPGDGEEGGDGG